MKGMSLREKESSREASDVAFLSSILSTLSVLPVRMCVCVESGRGFLCCMQFLSIFKICIRARFFLLA